MKLTELKLPGVYLVETKEFLDNRGSFTKVFNRDAFSDSGIENIDFQEIYYSISNKNVVRGMHFQLPPYDHAKLVYVVSGEITDVVLDIRQKSKTYGQYITVELNDSNRNALYIPCGLAHGFLSQKDGSVVVYQQTSCYMPQSDAGIAWNSFGYDWQVTDPIISERDRSFVKFSDFHSPF